jgi:hypothetical protein
VIFAIAKSGGVATSRERCFGDDFHVCRSLEKRLKKPMLDHALAPHELCRVSWLQRFRLK